VHAPDAGHLRLPHQPLQRAQGKRGQTRSARSAGLDLEDSMGGTTPQKLAGELLGSAILAGTVIGSGVLATRFSHGNDAVALLGNTAATGAMLFVLVSTLGPLSGAHFNPAVSMVMALR